MPPIPTLCAGRCVASAGAEDQLPRRTSPPSPEAPPGSRGACGSHGRENLGVCITPPQLPPLEMDLSPLGRDFTDPIKKFMFP